MHARHLGVPLERDRVRASASDSYRRWSLSQVNDLLKAVGTLENEERAAVTLGLYAGLELGSGRRVRRQR